MHAAVIGAGVMGSGIAQWLSSRGVSVILRDVKREQLDRGLANIEKTYGEAVKRGLMSEEKAKQGRARIVASTNPGEMRDVADRDRSGVGKNRDQKADLRDLAAKTRTNAILATNTSALPISELGATTGQPGRVIGLHFFNPVSRMKLVEVVVGKQTAPETASARSPSPGRSASCRWSSRTAPDFSLIACSFLSARRRGAFRERREREGNRRRACGWGMPMGPLRLIDEIGVDITVDIADTLEKAYRRARSRAGDSAEDAGGENARPENGQRLLQIRRQTANA